MVEPFIFISPLVGNNIPHNNFAILLLPEPFLPKILIRSRVLNEKFSELRSNLLEQGVDVELDSVYRSLAIQQDLFEEFKEKYWEEYASKYATPSGYSEHHTWLAVDICIKKENWEIISENHEMIVECETFEKVHETMVEYGFIVRYPDWKENITWYTYEPRHLRYIWDVNIAKEIYEKWLTLEEYLGVVKVEKFIN